MLMMPSIFNNNYMDNWMDDVEKRFFGNTNSALNKCERFMETDVRETEDAYELQMDLPGFKKEDIHLELSEGYLNIEATRNEESEEKNENGKVIRRERFLGNRSRRFYVGDEIKEEEVKAKFENGVLDLLIPKKKEEEKIPEKKFIPIEG